MKRPEDMTHAQLVAYVLTLKAMIHTLQATIRRMDAEQPDADHDSHDETTYPHHS